MSKVAIKPADSKLRVSRYAKSTKPKNANVEKIMGGIISVGATKTFTSAIDPYKIIALPKAKINPWNKYARDLIVDFLRMYIRYNSDSSKYSPQ